MRYVILLAVALIALACGPVSSQTTEEEQLMKKLVGRWFGTVGTDSGVEMTVQDNGEFVMLVSGMMQSTAKGKIIVEGDRIKLAVEERNTQAVNEWQTPNIMKLHEDGTLESVPDAKRADIYKLRKA
jgi:hypothetical protein